MRVYISGPITGTTDYMLRFAVAEKQLQIQGYEVFNPARVNAGMPEVATWEDYMKVAEAVLSCCDTIYMLRGWENSRGAVKEYHLAMAAGMVVLKENGGMMPCG